jgi:hypothetical protein
MAKKKKRRGPEISLPDQFENLWTQPVCESNAIEQAISIVERLEQSDLVECLLWWTQFAKQDSIPIEAFRQVLEAIVRAWPHDQIGEVLRHMKEERQILDRKTIDDMPQERRSHYVAMSACLVSLLLNPART